MKNLFEKDDHTGLYVGIAIGAAAGINLGWLYLRTKVRSTAGKLAEN